MSYFRSAKNHPSLLEASVFFFLTFLKILKKISFYFFLERVNSKHMTFCFIQQVFVYCFQVYSFNHFVELFISS